MRGDFRRKVLEIKVFLFVCFCYPGISRLFFKRWWWEFFEIFFFFLFFFFLPWPGQNSRSVNAETLPLCCVFVYLFVCVCVCVSVWVCSPRWIMSLYLFQWPDGGFELQLQQYGNYPISQPILISVALPLTGSVPHPNYSRINSWCTISNRVR